MAISIKKIYANNQNLEKNVLYSVVTCFMEHKREVLLLQRARRDAQYGKWGIPGGKLQNSETPDLGLQREVAEETGIKINTKNLQLLSKAKSVNPYDGSYLLYLYYLTLENKPEIVINTTEHMEYKWVNIDNFLNESLLVSQGKAFEIVKSKLDKLIKITKRLK